MWVIDGKVEFDHHITSKCRDIFQLAAIDGIGMQAIQKFEGTFQLRESSLTFPGPNFHGYSK